MKKTLLKLIVGILLTFLCLVNGSFIVAQNTPSPQPKATVSQSSTGPVILDSRTLFVLRTDLGGLSARERGEQASKALQDVAENQVLSPDKLEVYSGDKDQIPLTTISLGNFTLINISDADAKIADKTRSELAQEYSQKIKTAISRYRKERSLQYFLWATSRSVIATVILTLFLLIIHNVFARIYQKLKVWGQSYIRPVRLGDWELIQANQLDNIITSLMRLIQLGIVLGLLTLYLTFVLEQFPWTRGLAATFQSYLGKTLIEVWEIFVNYFPNLLTIIFVTLLTYFLIRLSKPFFKELGEGKFSLPGFYPEWAQPTHRIATLFMIALAAAIIIPLLPGFQSPAFQGVSVFLGLLISLGSSSIISNLISGSVLIYTRAFRVGDYIKIDNTMGKVMETTLLVTRIITSTNVVVSIPNSKISNGSIENYSLGHREFKQTYIIQSIIFLGYEVSWREAYKTLQKAALQTDGIAKSPEPYILQGTLNNVYVTYLVNVYLDMNYFQGKHVRLFEQARSQLYENIRDCCDAAGIRMLTPGYEADPTRYGPVVEGNSSHQGD